jgi:NAD(P)-dependent dehydrogenase (short-subunit alcohol dehydrogenase family)
VDVIVGRDPVSHFPNPTPAAELTGRAALITGGASGLGAAIAKGMAAVGAAVMLVDRDEDGLKRIEREIAGSGGLCRVSAIDLGDVSAPAQVVEFAVGQFGKLSIVVHSAGVHEQSPFQTMTTEAFDHVYAVNVRAPYFITQHCLPYLLPGSSIIFIGSTGAVAAIPGGFSAYCSTKGAVHSLMRTLAVELAPYNVRVNEIVPGAFDTPINAAAFNNDPTLAEGIIRGTPLERLGQPDDIVGPALFLVSDGARHVHGASLVVDGGFTIL